MRGRYALESECLDYRAVCHASEGCCEDRRLHITVDTPIRSSYTSDTQAGYDCQGYIAENVMAVRVPSLTFLQAARTSVMGCEHWHRLMIRSETTWLDKP
jgi:hypothetical protein